jgi:hypothetical protein
MVAFPKHKRETTLKKEEPTKQDELIRVTLEELKAQFPGKTLLNIQETAQAYGFKNVQSIYNGLRKNAVSPFPVKPIKRCGKWYWNIVRIAADQAGQ